MNHEETNLHEIVLGFEENLIVHPPRDRYRISVVVRICSFSVSSWEVWAKRWIE